MERFPWACVRLTVADAGPGIKCFIRTDIPTPATMVSSCGPYLRVGNISSPSAPRIDTVTVTVRFIERSALADGNDDDDELLQLKHGRSVLMGAYGVMAIIVGAYAGIVVSVEVNFGYIIRGILLEVNQYGMLYVYIV